MWTLPVVSSSGNALVTLAAADENNAGEPKAPVLHALVVVEIGGTVLFCHAIAHGIWELPGGEIETGESARDAAARELFEEIGIRVKPSELVWVGLAGYRLRDGRGAHAALFRLATRRKHDLVVNAEMDGFVWINPSLGRPETSLLDLAIAEWTIAT